MKTAGTGALHELRRSTRFFCCFGVVCSVRFGRGRCSRGRFDQDVDAAEPEGILGELGARSRSRARRRPRPNTPGGCGGIGRRAGFRYQWGQPLGGSTPLIRTDLTSNGPCPTRGIVVKPSRFWLPLPVTKNGMLFTRVTENRPSKGRGQRVYDGTLEKPHRMAVHASGPGERPIE